MELSSLTIPYAKNKAKKGREDERMEELDNLISNPADTDHITRQMKTGRPYIVKGGYLPYL